MKLILVALKFYSHHIKSGKYFKKTIPQTLGQKKTPLHKVQGGLALRIES